jgi:hypothetical protein
MAKIAIPTDLAVMFTACEDAYEQAAREDFAENPTVVAAVSALKSAWTALHLANNNYATAKGVFSVEFAAIRVDRACRASRDACIKLHAAIKEAAAEQRLYERCLTMANHSPDADQAGDGVTVQQNGRLRLQATEKEFMRL